MPEKRNWTFVVSLDVLHSDIEEEQESGSEGETSLTFISCSGPANLTVKTRNE